MKKSKKFIIAGASALALALAIWGFPWIRNQFLINNTPAYESEAQLQKELNIEKHKLELDDVIFNARFGEEGKQFLGLHLTTNTYVRKVGDKRYELILGSAKNRTSLRHELFHAYEIEQGRIPPSPPKNIISSGYWKAWAAELRAQNYSIEEN